MSSPWVDQRQLAVYPRMSFGNGPQAAKERSGNGSLHLHRPHCPIALVTRYEKPEAVILSIAEYDALTGREPVDLQQLEDEFVALLLRMQQPSHRRAVDALFATGGAASPSTRRVRRR